MSREYKHIKKAWGKALDKKFVEGEFITDDFLVEEIEANKNEFVGIKITYKHRKTFVFNAVYDLASNKWVFRYTPNENELSKFAKETVASPQKDFQLVINIVPKWLKFLADEEEDKLQPKKPKPIFDEKVYEAEILEDDNQARTLTDEERELLITALETVISKMEFHVVKHPDEVNREEVEAFKKDINEAKEEIRKPETTVGNVRKFFKELFREGGKKYFLDHNFRNEVNGYIIQAFHLAKDWLLNP